jgi:NitT/TauT family transport system ATP-binding protein
MAQEAAKAGPEPLPAPIETARPGLGGALSIRESAKAYRSGGSEILALSDCSLEIGAGEFAAVVGPSGCGKTTLLNAIAGFHDLSSGEIRLDEEVICSPSGAKPPGADRIVVFQNGALFPWMTVLQNAVFGPLSQKRLPPKEAEEEALSMLDSMGLSSIAWEYPDQISSGMRRRAEIARAMMNRPRVLLLDEPFRALDALTKTVAHQFLLDVYDRNRTTVFFITHDLDEAVFLGDKVYVMTTRPGSIKRVIEVALPRPRPWKLLASPEFQALRAECLAIVREEAEKAFRAGEKER